MIGGRKCAGQEHTEDVTPQYINCVNLFYEKVDNRLKSDKTAMNSNFKILSAKMNNGQKELTVLKAKVDALDEKISAALANLESGSQSSGATTQSLSQIEDSISATLNEMATNLEGQVRAIVDSLLTTHFGTVQQDLTDAMRTCGSNIKLSELLQEVKNVKDDMAKVNTGTEATMEEVKKCHQENTTETVENMMAKVEELKGEVEGLEAGIDLGLDAVMEAVVEVYNNTQPPAPPAPPQPDEITPCEDSTFRSTSSVAVCQSAVRFNKCYQKRVSYHCCNTCTAEGKLPEMGPWRYINQKREVSTLDVIRYFSP